MASKTIAQNIREFLEAAWEKAPDRRYAAAVATQVVALAAFCEKMFGGAVQRFKAIEARLSALETKHGVQGEQPDAVQGEQPDTTATADADATPPPQKNATPGHGDMVRLDSDNKPMSPEDQAIEEEADMKLLGAIDESRYAPRSAFPNAQV